MKNGIGQYSVTPFLFQYGLKNCYRIKKAGSCVQQSYLLLCGTQQEEEQVDRQDRGCINQYFHQNVVHAVPAWVR